MSLNKIDMEVVEFPFDLNKLFSLTYTFDVLQ